MKQFKCKYLKGLISLVFVFVLCMSLNQVAKAAWVQGDDQKTYYQLDDGTTVTGWKTIDGARYYFDPAQGGAKVTGWFNYKEKWFYFNAEGKKQTGLLTIDGKKYYVDSAAGRYTGWKTVNNVRYYFNPNDNGAAATGWLNYKEKYFYFNANGKKLTGLLTIDGRKYYVDSAAGRYTGWKTVNNVRYYFNPNDNGAASVGWINYKGKLFYFDANGAKKTGWVSDANGKYYVSSSAGALKGWQTVATKRYYFDPETGRMQTGWFDNPSNGRRYYLGTDGVKVTGWKTIDDKRYYFDSYGRMTTGWITYKGKEFYMGTDGVKQVGLITVDGKQYMIDASKGKVPYTPVPEPVTPTTPTTPDTPTTPSTGGAGSKTIKGLLQAAIQPLGSTLYVTGGGWESQIIGVSPKWAEFYATQNSSYDYNKYAYQRELGFDCSGYVGWCVYNLMESQSEKQSYTVVSGEMGKFYADKGWGTTTATASVKDWKAGDICYNANHVFLVVGACSDGSFVLLHASAPGVRMCGTPNSSGSYSSEAVSLATNYMKKYYPNWCAKFPNKYMASTDFKTNYNRFRWNTSGTVKDPDGYTSKTAAQILADLYGEY